MTMAKLRHVICFCLISFGQISLAQSNSETFSSEAARQRAVDSLEAGYPQDTRLLTDALLSIDPDDVSALLLSAYASAALREYERAKVAARRAYRLAHSRSIRYQAARLMAVSHANSERLTLAQIWVRRAQLNSPSPMHTAALARDYRQLRQSNDFQFNFDFSITPSSNVNNGSSKETITLPGLPFELALSPTSQALSGHIITYSAQVNYRLANSADARSIGYVSVSGTHVTLSDSAQVAAPTTNARNYDQQRYAVGVRTDWQPSWTNRPLQANLEYGQTAYGGKSHTQYWSGSLGTKWLLTDRDLMSATAKASSATYAIDDIASRSYGIELTWQHMLNNGSRIAFNAGLQDTVSTSASRDFTRRSLSVTYVPHLPSDAFNLSFNYAIGVQSFADTTLAIEGRSDRSQSLNMTLGLKNFDLYGFKPELTLQLSDTQSNVALFDTESVGLGLSFRSSF